MRYLSAWISIVLLLPFGVRAQDQLPLPKVLAPQNIVVVPLQIEDVFNSVEKHYPLLMAVERERQITAGKLMSAQGAFDNVIKSKYNNEPGNSSYPSNYFDFGIEQATPYGGLTYFSGYRVSEGNFPDYYGKNFTGDGGEFRGGLALPLLRDSSIDRRRASLAQAGIDRAIAEPIIRRQRLDAFRAAARSYWAWVATGQRLKITRRLLAIAQDRDQALAMRVQQGAIAPIERTDNQQTIADRQGRLAVAERRFQEASFTLSLYYRDAAGRSVVVGEEHLPAQLPELIAFDQNKVDDAVAMAATYRPELQRLRLLRERIEVDLRLAENQTLPGVNAIINAAQDIGAGKKNLDRTTLELSIGVDLPIQRRDARGKVLSAQGQLLQLAAQERMANDQIVAEVRDTLSALDRAFVIRQRAKERVNFASQVEEGERRKLLLGQSSILTLNLRELATFDAALTVVDAEFEYFRALADYRAALGLDNP